MNELGMDGTARRWVPRRALAAMTAALACIVTGAPGAAASPELPPQGKLLALNDNMAPPRHGLTTWDYVELSRAAGANAARTNIDWRAAEPSQGVWDAAHWNAWQKFYDEAVLSGITPIFVIGFAPTWARDPEYQRCTIVGACELPPSRTMDDAWARFAAEVARRFPQATIEIWNEPNLKIYWETEGGPDPARFTELVEIAAKAIREVSPDARIISGGVANLETTGSLGIAHDEFLAAVLERLPALTNLVDEVGLHIYPYSSDIGPGSLFQRSLDRARQALAAGGAEGARLAITETGVSRGDPESLSPELQADTTMRIVRELLAAADVGTVVLHSAIEPLDTSAMPRNHGFGLVAYGSDPPVPYPAYCALAGAAESSYPGCAGERPLGVIVDVADGQRVAVGEELAVRTPNFRAMLACSFDDAAVQLCAMPLRVPDLGDGTHTLTVQAIDTTTWTASEPTTRTIEVGAPAPDDGTEPPPEPDPEPDPPDNDWTPPGKSKDGPPGKRR